MKNKKNAKIIKPLKFKIKCYEKFLHSSKNFPILDFWVPLKTALFFGFLILNYSNAQEV